MKLLRRNTALLQSLGKTTGIIDLFLADGTVCKHDLFQHLTIKVSTVAQCGAQLLPTTVQTTLQHRITSFRRLVDQV
nr:MAG: hypothetical protein [Bacteriophage sp.]